VKGVQNSAGIKKIKSEDPHLIEQDKRGLASIDKLKGIPCQELKGVAQLHLELLEKEDETGHNLSITE